MVAVMSQAGEGAFAARCNPRQSVDLNFCTQIETVTVCQSRAESRAVAIDAARRCNRMGLCAYRNCAAERQAGLSHREALDALLTAICHAPSARGWASALVGYETLLMREFGYGGSAIGQRGLGPVLPHSTNWLIRRRPCR
jgi:hypothetical protein